MDGIEGSDWDSNLNSSYSSVKDLDKNDLTDEELYGRELRFNNALREIFLNRFVHIFSAYEHFVIQPNQVGVYLFLVKVSFRLC